VPRIAAVVLGVLLVWGTLCPLSFAQQLDHEMLAQQLQQLQQTVAAWQQTQVDKAVLTQAIANLETLIRAAEEQAAAHPDLLTDLRAVLQQLRAAMAPPGARQAWPTYRSPLAAATPVRPDRPEPVAPAQPETAVSHDGMVLIPAGNFWFGSDPNDAQRGPEELPRRQVHLAAYLIAPYEVTNAAYQQFRPSHTFPAGQEEFPVGGVTWLEAQQYAQWAGARLCTEAEWEKVAKGPGGSTFPFGDAFAPDMARLNLDLTSGPARVGSYPRDRSGYGVFDMAGNVFEWTATSPDGQADLRVLRGGAWFTLPTMGRSTARDYASPEDADETLGFRVCRDVQE